MINEQAVTENPRGAGLPRTQHKHLRLLITIYEWAGKGCSRN
jgi:hypothetical protein